MKNKSIIFLLILLFSFQALKSEEQERVMKLTLKEAIILAQLQSVEAAVALNQLKTAYWEYRTHQADQLPEINFTGYLPAYNKKYTKYQNSDGTYTYIQDHNLGLTGDISIDQNVPLTGGSISLNTSLDFTRQLGNGAYNQYMSVPIGLTYNQPIFGVNKQKWQRKIEPVKYQEAKAAYMESVEVVTMNTISNFFNLLLAQENLEIAKQNMENANKLYDIAIAKRQIGHISESELMQLNLSSLQAQGKVTEAISSLNANMFKLRSFLGLSEEDNIEPVVPETLTSLSLYYQDVLDKAQTNNSFAKNILRRRLEADYAVATAKGNQRSISLFASVGYTGKDKEFRRAYNDLMTNQIVQVGVSIPLLDWGKRKGQVKVAESNREVLILKTQQEEMNFNQDVFLLVENFNNQAAQLEIARQADEIAQKRYVMSIETFLIGKISTLDLNDAQNSKDDARQKHIYELYNYWWYYYNVRNLTLYDYLNNRDIEADIEEIVKR